MFKSDMKILLAVMLIGSIPAALVRADGGSAPTSVPSDVDGKVLDIRLKKDELETKRTSLRMRAGGYTTSQGTNGTSASVSVENPTYIVGHVDRENTEALLAPVVSGGNARVDINNGEGSIDRYDVSVVGTGVRLRHRGMLNDKDSAVKQFGEYEIHSIGDEPNEYDYCRYHSQDTCATEFPKAHDEWVAKKKSLQTDAEKAFAAKKAELEKDGFDTSKLKLVKSDFYNKFYMVGEAVAKKDPAYGTIELVLAPVNLVKSRNKRMGTSEQGVRVGAGDISGHVAFTLNGVPIDLCGQVKPIQAVFGKSDFGDDRNVDMSIHWIDASACAGTRFSLPLVGQLQIRDEASFAWA
nr:hypothetical protein [uncultured bacterium]